MKDTDIIAAIAPDAVSLMDKAIAEIKRLRQENATLTAERDALWRLTDRLFAEHDALRAERDEAIIHANNVVRESSSLITAKIPCGSCGGYWNAVDNFRRFETKTT